jgi:peptidoglycan/xylan/chitin deacetylase (PgdA/CDA1 family)
MSVARFPDGKIMTKFTVVMYHYVRDLSGSDYPEIKGLEKNLFVEQIRYFTKHYSVIRMEDLIQALDDKITLPPMALLLTFDDGYKDHLENVMPILMENRIQGTFFISAKTLAEEKVLDMNKIHYILASAKDKTSIINEIRKIIHEYGDPTIVRNYENQKNRSSSSERRYDAGETGLIKDLLQKLLPANLRKSIVGELFRKYVSKNERQFAKDLYMNSNDIRIMQENGMFIGNHGYDHVWLDTLAGEEQAKELENSIELLRSIGCCGDEVVFSYPYGAHNGSMVSLLKERGVALAFTTRCDLAECSNEHRYLFPRLDTNDLPKSGCAEPCDWTNRALECK